MIQNQSSEFYQSYVTLRNGYNPISREDMKGLRQSKKDHPNCVFLGNNRWSRLKINILFVRIKRWNIKNGLFLENNRHPRIMKLISYIQLPKLKQLNLSQNNIESLSDLPRLFAPNLVILTIQNNYITTSGSLRKSTFPKLKTLSINNNPIIDLNRLSQMKLNESSEIWVGKKSWESQNGSSNIFEAQQAVKTRRLENKSRRLVFFSQFMNLMNKKKKSENEEIKQ